MTDDTHGLALPLRVHTPRWMGEPKGWLEIQDDTGGLVASVDTLGWLTEEQERAIATLLAAAPLLEAALARLLDAAGSGCEAPLSDGSPSCGIYEVDDQCSRCQARAALLSARVRKAVGR